MIKVGMEFKAEVGRTWKVVVKLVGEFTADVSEKWDVVVKVAEQILFIYIFYFHWGKVLWWKLNYMYVCAVVVLCSGSQYQ